jgi:hypothetical protein
MIASRTTMNDTSLPAWITFSSSPFQLKASAAAIAGNYNI